MLVAGCAAAASAQAAGRPSDSRSSGRHAAQLELKAGPAEPLIAVISLAEQEIEVFGPRGRIAHSRISTGMAGHDTPTGVFSVLQRNRYHRSNIYSNAPMPYMQRLTWSGIALHEGHVPGYRASHGCIRLPAGFAANLWGLGRVGMRVIVTPTGVRPVHIVHSRLPSPRSLPRPEATGLVRVATAEGTADRAGSLLSPYDAAQARLARATVAKGLTERAVKPALEHAAAKAAEARMAAAALKASSGILTDADEHLELERLGMVTVQTETAEAGIRARIQVAEAGRAAALEAYEELRRVEATASDAAFAAARMARDAEAATQSAIEELALARKATSPISVFVSRKTGQIHVRQGFDDLHEGPVAIAAPELPLGTHVFTALEDEATSAIRWVVVTVPTSGHQIASRRAISADQTVAPPSSASEALDRVEFPHEIRELIAERLWPGASLIVSDAGLGETGKATDFVILTK